MFVRSKCSISSSHDKEKKINREEENLGKRGKDAGNVEKDGNERKAER